MSRSRNSKRGFSRTHNKRHHTCSNDKFGCPYCESNFVHAETKQKLKGTEDTRRVKED